MSSDAVNQENIIAEVRSEFERYEQALIDDDTQALNGFFWAHARVVRYGVAEHSTGIEAVSAARAQIPRVHPGRRLFNTVITTFGRDSASVCTEFRSPDTSQIGRQTQTWIRFDHGWRIVAAHVSLIDGDRLTLY